MPIIYSQTQLTAGGMQTKQYTTSRGTVGVVVTNYSNYALDIAAVSGGVHTTVPPYAIGKFQLGENQVWTVGPSTSLSLAAAIPNAPMYVDFQDSMFGVEPAIIPLAQLPAYELTVSGNVELTGSSNTVNIGNTPSVTLTGTPLVQITGTSSVNIANTPAVTLAGAGNNVNIANTPAVTITGTPTVQLTASGNSVNIANTPAVTVSGTPNMNVTNTSIPVANAAGGTLNIAGQVNIGNTPSVNISGTPNVNIASGSVNATIQNATIDTQLTNALINTGTTAKSEVGTLTISNLADGSFSGDVYVTLPMSMYDMYTLQVNSANALLPSNHYSPIPVFFGINGIGATAIDGSPIPYIGGNAYNASVSYPTYMVKNSSAQLGNVIGFSFKNISGSTIVSDTLTITVYARYSSSTVTNPSSNPVPISSNYYGTGADGMFNSTGDTLIFNPANAPGIYNYTSFTVNSGHTVSFASQAKYVLIYCTGDVTINGTIKCPGGMTNIGAPVTALNINGKNVPNAGSGGAGGAGAGGGSGAAGGSGNCYAAGAGGGGGGGLGGAGFGGGTGYGAVAGGAGGTYNGAHGSDGGSANTFNSGTLCIVAGGTITINGTIYGAGVKGGIAGSGVFNSSVNASLGGGGGSCGPNQGGAGGNSPGVGNVYGGGGAGGSGGASVFLFAGGVVNVFGSINVSAGAGGDGAYGSIAAGQAGTAGAVTIWQLGGNGGGL